MNRRIKKILSLVVAVLMIMSAVPMSSFALTMCDMIDHNIEMVVTKEATCTEAGLKTERCTRSNCDYTTGKTEVIPLKSHTIATIDPVAPTCGKDGNTAGAYCTVCELITVSCETIPAYGHTLVDFPAVQPTCGVNGMNAGKKCSICNEVITGGEPIIAGDHDYKQVSFTAGSCRTGTPTKEVKKCKVCGDTKTTTKAAECDFGKWITQSIATCSVAGKMTRTCSECGTTEEKAIDKTPHTEVIVVATASTCTKPGNTAGKKCTVCNAITQGCETIPATHQADWEIISESTCTMEGERKGFCYVCEKNIVETIPMKDHKFQYIDGKPSSCYYSGWELVRCVHCSYEFERVIEAQHDFGNWITQSISTCTVSGKMTRTCAGCWLTEEKVIDRVPHTEVVVVAVSATCDKAGKNAGKMCTVCNSIVQGCEVIPAFGHREIVTEGYDAVCGKKGLSDGTYCNVCNKVLRPQVEIAALDHVIEIDNSLSIVPTCTTVGCKVEKCVRVGCDYVKTITIPETHNTDWNISLEPTCTTEGMKSGYCTSCKQTVVDTIPAIGHIVTNELSWRTTSSPTCTKDGEKVATCARCGGQAVETVPALGHEKEIVTPAIEATCTEYGLTASIRCLNCRMEMQKAIPVEPTGHSYIKDSAKSVEATCTIEGRFYGKCKNCGDVKDEIIAVTEHNYISSGQTVVKPTCTQTGVAIRVCKDCINIETITLDIIGHTDVNFDGKCDMCGVTGGFVAENCSCNCHKTGLANVFFKFMLFFQKIFRVNATCKCGQAHY